MSGYGELSEESTALPRTTGPYVIYSERGWQGNGIWTITFLALPDCEFVDIFSNLRRGI